MNRKRVICLFLFLLAHVPWAFGGNAGSQDTQLPALCANGDASNIEDEILQAPTASPDNPASEEICRLLSMPLHLRNILQFLTFEQLKACKGVSKKWYGPATYALSLKPRFRLQLPPLLTPPLPPCTGLSCETTVVVVPDPTTKDAATPKDVSKAAPLTDRDRVTLFLEHLFKEASKRAWKTPCNRLSVTFNKGGTLFLEKLKPAAVILTLPQGIPLPVPNFQHVRHLYLNDQHVPTTFFALLAQAPLETLYLSKAKIIRADENDPSFYQAIFQLRHLTDLKDLNLAHLKAMDDWHLGEAIWQETCQQLDLEADAELLPTHIEKLTDNNPISHLENLEKLDLTNARLSVPTTCLNQCAFKLRVLHMAGNTLDHTHHAFLNTLPNLEELTPPALDWFFGEAEAKEHHRSVQLGEGIANHDSVAPFQIVPKLRVLNLDESGLDNTYLKRLTALQTIENLNVRQCYIQGPMPDDDNADDLQTQGHILLGQFPLKVLNASLNITLHRVPVFTQAPLLTELKLVRCGLRSFEGLNACINLRVFYAGTNPVTPSEAWCHMTDLKQLRVLNVLNNQGIHQYDEATRATCMQVLSQNTHLTSLILMGHGIGPEGAAALEGLIRLEKLDLRFCGIGDAGFQKLPLSKMKELDVRNNGLTHESMRHLRQILDQLSRPCLRRLTLASNPLGNEGVACLAPMTYLKRLNLWNTNATAEGMQVLAPLVPHLDALVCEDHPQPQAEDS